MASAALPQVTHGQWIRVSDSVDGYVFHVNGDGSLEVGYYQNRLKAIKETVVWNDTQWDFKYSGPNGFYLRGANRSSNVALADSDKSFREPTRCWPGQGLRHGKRVILGFINQSATLGNHSLMKSWQFAAIAIATAVACDAHGFGFGPYRLGMSNAEAKAVGRLDCSSHTTGLVVCKASSIPGIPETENKVKLTFFAKDRVEIIEVGYLADRTSVGLAKVMSDLHLSCPSDRMISKGNLDFECYQRPNTIYSVSWVSWEPHTRSERRSGGAYRHWLVWAMPAGNKVDSLLKAEKLRVAREEFKLRGGKAGERARQYSSP